MAEPAPSPRAELAESVMAKWSVRSGSEKLSGCFIVHVDGDRANVPHTPTAPTCHTPRAACSDRTNVPHIPRGALLLPGGQSAAAAARR